MTLRSSPRAVITGAGSGLGRAFAMRLARRGARLLLSDIAREGVDETARLARDQGASDVHVMLCDVGEARQVQALEQRASELFGGTDLMVNNAGVGAGGQTGTVPVEDWEWAIRINLMGVVHGCHAFLPGMRAQGSGHILNVASAAGLLNMAEMGPYNVSKAGVVALSETLASELYQTGVGVTVLCPTFFPTNILNASRNHSEKGSRIARKLMDASRFTADDVAESALRAAERDELYCVPMADGRWLWRTKRLYPEGFHRGLLGPVLRFLQKIRR